MSRDSAEKAVIKQDNVAGRGLTDRHQRDLERSMRQPGGEVREGTRSCNNTDVTNGANRGGNPTVKAVNPATRKSLQCPVCKSQLRPLISRTIQFLAHPTLRSLQALSRRGKIGFI